MSRLFRSDVRERALDIEFNAAVLAMAHRLFPRGFEVANDAPQSYEELVARLDAGMPMLVWRGGSQNSIYGNPEVNYAFRAWHDWCHWRGRHDFSFEGEMAAYRMQAEHLVVVYGDCPRTKWWQRILHAEIIGQRQFYNMLGYFPDDQRDFVEAYLAGDERAAAE